MRQVTPPHGRPVTAGPRRPVEGGSSVVSAAVARVVGARDKTRATQRDPAPSRAAYRIHRLWLTPTFRLMLRAGLPAVLVLALVGGWFARAENRQAVVDTVHEIRREIANRPEFRVTLMAIDGASDELAQDIREVVPIDLPVSSFDLDLAGMHDRIEELDAVARAQVRVRAGGILQIDITERVPAILWRGPQGLELLDRQGHRVASAARRQTYPDLPLIAGEGGDAHVAEALELIATAAPVAGRLRGLVRVGERRWDVVLDRDQVLMLPEAGAVSALQQILALDQAQDLLTRDIAAVDMRNPQRPTLRLGPDAMALRRGIDARETGVSLND